MDILRMDEKTLQYFSDGQSVCRQIDDVIQSLQQCERDIDENREYLRKKRRTYMGSKFWLMFVVVLLAFVPIVVIASLFTTAPIWILAFPCAICAAYYIRRKYIKDVLPVYENIYGKYIEAEQNYMKELIEELYIDRNQYEGLLHLIPSSMRHEIAMDIMKESVESGYNNNLHDAITFYKDRYKIIRKSPEPEALLVRQEIESSEECAAERLNIMTNLETIASEYV